MTPSRLLLLEDDPAIAHTVAYALGRDGFEVHHVMLVREADELLLTPRGEQRPTAYAAAILDVGLPDGSGLDLCRRLRERQVTLPIVMLTARNEEMDRVLGLELGADDYMAKPFSPRELVARVRALLRRAGYAAAQSVPTVEPAAPKPLLALDVQCQRVACGGEWLPLTRIEFGLLATLMRTPGRIWSRQALLDAVWGHDSDSTDRTVDTHVKTLRAKLRDGLTRADVPVAVDPIVTHRGQGYSLDLAVLPARS